MKWFFTVFSIVFLLMAGYEKFVTGNTEASWHLGLAAMNMFLADREFREEEKAG